MSITATQHDPVYTDAELAPLVGVKRITLQQWRARKQGPPYVKVGPRAVRYRWSEVAAWLDAGRIVNGAGR